jgi:hypothetical protein
MNTLSVSAKQLGEKKHSSMAEVKNTFCLIVIATSCLKLYSSVLQFGAT